MALVLLVVGVLEFVLAYRLWVMRPWACALRISLAIVSLILAILLLGHGVWLRQPVTGGIAIATIWYLLTARSRAALRS